jgi:aminoglycoside phosphotransferase family enzyme/predicted kinase
MTDSDGAVVAFLVRQAGDAATQIRTHASDVVIGRRDVFKLKKPIATAYLDFSTPERRLAFCEREIALNRRADPDGLIYRGVRRITREADGRLAFDGEGALVDAVVWMHPFDQAGLLDRLAEDGPLPGGLVDDLAAAIARFHAAAEVSGDAAGAARMARVLDVNARAFAESGLLSAVEAQALDAAFRQALDRHAALLDRRAAAGLVRRCHGDLHLRNVCVIDGRPILFDALEFAEDLATTDVLYDVAFLIMDLWHRGQRAAANRLMNRWCEACGDEDGLAALPFLAAVRAAVRAHVAAAAGDRAEGASYLALARDALEPAPARLVAIGGLSGSGKSSLAVALAPELGAVPGARILSSDRLRKQRFGVGPLERLGPEAYEPEVSTAVYAAMRERAAVLLAAGVAVVADAVHARRDERDAIAAVAAKAQVPFVGIWLDLPAERLAARVASRQGDPSDATVAVVAAQQTYALGPIAWRRLDAGLPLAALVVAAQA